jgi:hypothetical protein
MALDIQVIQAGAAKADPYTIVFVANPALEAPWQTGNFIADSMPANKAGFDAAVSFAIDCIFGRLPTQAEVFMSSPAIGANVRIVSIRETGLAATAANALSGESILGRLLAPRRNEIVAYVRAKSIQPDVVFVVSASTQYTRASAYGTTDDTTRGGTAFTRDGAASTHWHFPDIPGTAVLHETTRSLAPLHEFGHASSSYQSGFVADLYVDGNAELNRKVKRPIPAIFGTYAATTHSSDTARAGIGYPPNWTSFHCQHLVPALPSAMDDYTGTANPLLCRHDEITVRYLTDRLVAKIGR